MNICLESFLDDKRYEKISCPWRRKWQRTPVFLPGKFHDRGAWGAIAHGFAKSQRQLRN